jgi:hypothetical protein
MKLEYRILEAENKPQSCNYCLLYTHYRYGEDITFTPATHEIVAYRYDNDGDCADIAVICNNCKRDLESGTLPYCELCGRSKRNRVYCLCSRLENNKIKQERTSKSFDYHLEKKTKKLEKDLSATKRLNNRTRGGS